jgi:RHS repeat-associated protein
MVLLLVGGAGAARAEDSTNGLIVTAPNGYANLSAEDLQVRSTVGSVRWVRSWNGQEWKFNPQWESLSQSWNNLTGSQTQDSSPNLSSGSSGASGVVLDTPAPRGTVSMSGGGGDGCWVWVDEDWQPTYAAIEVSTGLRDAGPMIPLRSTPFNRVMGDASSDYAAAVRVSVDFASLCAGSSAASGAVSMEGVRRINELHLGENGRYAFNNRTVLEKRAVLQQAPASVGALASGRIALAAVSNDKGFRWIDRSGAWIDYNTQGQVVAYGDRNNNVVWLVRDAGGTLRGVVDANGRVLFTLHYTGQLVTELRDYPIAGVVQELPSRSVKYAYDERNRLTQVTDVRGNVLKYDYDIANHVVKITDQEGRVEQLIYAGEVVKRRTAPDGGVTDYEFDYDDTNKQFVSKITGPETAAGRRVEDVTQNRVGQLVRRSFNGQTSAEARYDTGTRSETVTDARGSSTRTTRNEFGQPVEVVNPDGSVVKYGYSALNLTRTEKTDEAGTRTEYQRDARGNLLKTTLAAATLDESVIEYERSALGQTTKVTRKGRTESDGTVTADSVWSAEFDPQGQLRKNTDPEGHVTSFVFDRRGHLAQVIDALGRVMAYETDAAGNLVRATDAAGQQYTYAYDKVGNLTEQTDARGKALRIGYDAMNRPQSATNTAGGTARIEYDLQGRPTRVSDEDGQSIELEFDALLRLVRVTDGRGNAADLSYQIPDGSQGGRLGSLDQPTQVKLPTFTSDTRFDLLGRPTNQSFLHTNSAGPEQSTGSRSYDKGGRIVSETDAYGKTRQYTYNTLGKLLTAKDALGATTRAAYDVRGNLIRLTDASGNATVFEYDRNDRLMRETLPLGQVTRFVRDEVGNVRQRVDGLGNTDEYTYDGLDRITQILRKGADGRLLRTVAYTWLGNKLVAWSETDATLPSGQQVVRATLAYDDGGRKISEAVTYPTPDGGDYTLSYGYTYSAAGRKTQLTWADGTTIGYGYSSHGELEEVIVPGEGSISVNQFRWTAPSQVTLPGGTVQNKTYDGLLNLQTNATRTPGQQTTLSLQNNFGKQLELKQVERTDADGGASSTVSHTYVYDDEGRLTQDSRDAGGSAGKITESFALDALANRTAHSAVAGAWTYDANHRLVQRGDAAQYGYDDAGNLIRKVQSGRATNYRYDSSNRLVEVRDEANRLVARYGYDAFGRRVWKEQFRALDGTPLAPARRSYYLHADEGLIAEATQDIVLGSDESVSASAAPQIRTQYGPRPDALFGTGLLFIKTRDSNGDAMVAYYHHDHLNTPIQATDKTGRVVWSASYDAFGRASITTPAATVERPTIESNLRLAGQYFDAETGLHYNRHRYYDVESGRYIQRDPIGLDGGLNPYVYIGGNPLQLIDPYGLSALANVLGSVGGVGGRIGGAVVGEAIFPPGGGVIGGIAGGYAGRAAGMALGNWLDSILFKDPTPAKDDDKEKEEEADAEASEGGASCPAPGSKIPNDKLTAPPRKRGDPPKGDDGHSVELHHRGQKPDSPLDEMTRTEHRGKGNFGKNHSNTGQSPSEVDHGSAWDKQRFEYWAREWDSGRFEGL